MSITVPLPTARADWLAELERRNLRRSTRRTHEATTASVLAAAETHEWRATSCMATPDAWHTWAQGLTHAPSTQNRMVGQAKSWTRYWVERGWVDADPTRTLRAPRFAPNPTLPFGRPEMRRILAAAAPDPQARALALLMRYSGLAIRDACTLPKAAIAGRGALTLRRAKTGVPVTLRLPDAVLAALRALRGPNPAYWWWTGNGQPETAAKRWGARLKRVFVAAGLPTARPHQFRDTFAVELLLAGVAMEDVSVLLGHASIRMTEQYYAPWDPSRRKRLLGITARAWKRDPILASLEESHADRPLP